MPEPKVLQGTPSGYLVDLGDGSEPRLFPESTLVQAGMVPATPGLYQSPNLGVAPLEAPQVAPPPEPTPMPEPQPAGMSQSTRQGYNVSTSTPGYISREKAFGPAPAPLDLSAERDALAANNTGIQASYDDAKAALDQRAGAEEGLGRVNAQLARDSAAQKPLDMAERAEFDAVVQEYTQAETARINERIARVPQEDPSRLWSQNNAFQNVAGLVAATLGGMLAVSTGSGRNMGLEAIERAIDRDINAQRTNIENEWKRIAHDKDSLQQYQQWKSKERAWLLEEQAVRYETLALNAEAEAQKFTSASKKAELAGVAAELRARMLESSNKAITEHAQLAQAESQSAMQRYQLLGESAVQRSQIAENYAQAAAANRANQGQAKPEPTNPVIYEYKDGRKLYLSPEFTKDMESKDIEAYRQKAAKQDNFAAEYDELIRDTNKLGRRSLLAPGKIGVGDPEVQALVNRAKRLAINYTTEKAATTFTDNFVNMISSMMGGPTGLTDVDKVPTMMEFKKSTLNEMDSEFRGRGAFIVQPATPTKEDLTRQGPTPNGMPVNVTAQLPSAQPYDAYRQYGANPIPADAAEGKPGAQLKGALTDLLHGTDIKSQVNSLESLLNYAVAPVGGGAGAIGIGGMLRNLKEVDLGGGKKGLSDRGGATPMTKEQAVKRLELQRKRLKVHAAKADVDPDRIDDMFDELIGYIEKEPEAVEDTSPMGRQINIR